MTRGKDHFDDVDTTDIYADFSEEEVDLPTAGNQFLQSYQPALLLKR